MKVQEIIKQTNFPALQTFLQQQQITCRQIVEYYLKNIDLKNKQLNAFIEIYAHEALTRASEIDNKITTKQPLGKLAGMVIGLKDVIAYQNHPLQASSKILQGFQSQFSATVVERLLAEDAIIIGRQNCDEFGMGSSNENSIFGAVCNALNPERVAGGSSGGSAVAVQADMCRASIGSDTGGSVRQPAAFCGVIGLKPTYSRISRWGLVAYASSFDCIGLITKDIFDTALLLEVIAGKDEYDSTVSQKPVPAYSQCINQSIKKAWRIAYLQEALQSTAVSPAVKHRTWQKIQQLQAEGHIVEPVSFPFLDYILPTYYILTTAEASSNLARYDGIKFGWRAENCSTIEQLYKQTRTQGFGREVRKRIMLGTYVLSADYYDAYYLKAQKVRQLIKQATDKLWQNYDFLILPTTPRTAFCLNEIQQEPMQMYLEDIFTVQANLTGIPAISIPNGIDEEGMPIGLQIMANYFQETQLLAFANAILQRKVCNFENSENQ
ncbi:MAG: Asp-tRNA(Asn)/Glu-tRNA(Gln) amidotransferase subunit GatA [Microscillaceae bacterium]|nr:Asp-tRNA(Asn)/Glu-tRNA(Gln) amidotransferase subunit GatA [Microscillaceae bacterium]MDW8459978.1 Asp-tRNA(Asn)/Glu-tRNA(Gln) amidotransferase subunit GatA [Cytophagales bacterium]